MKNIILTVAVLFSAKIAAQYVTTEIGGAGFYCPSLGFEYLLQDDTLAYANGTKFKIGAGYGDWPQTEPMAVVRVAIHQVWGKRNNWQAGAELGFPLNEAAFDLQGPLIYPSFGFNFGRGYARGLLSLGPLIIPFEDGGLIFSGPIVVPFANAGVSFRLF